MGRDPAVFQRHTGNGGAIGVAHHAGTHQLGVHGGVLQGEVAYLRVGGASEQALRPRLGLIDDEIGDGVALAVEGAGEGGFSGGYLLFLLAFTGGCVGADGCPFHPTEVDIGGQHIVSGEVVVDRGQFFDGADFNGRVALG